MRNKFKIKISFDVRKMVVSVYMTGKKKIIVPVTDPKTVQQIVTDYLKFEDA